MKWVIQCRNTKHSCEIPNKITMSFNHHFSCSSEVYWLLQQQCHCLRLTSVSVFSQLQHIVDFKDPNDRKMPLDPSTNCVKTIYPSTWKSKEPRATGHKKPLHFKQTDGTYLTIINLFSLYKQSDCKMTHFLFNSKICRPIQIQNYIQAYISVIAKHFDGKRELSYL